MIGTIRPACLIYEVWKYIVSKLFIIVTCVYLWRYIERHLQNQKAPHPMGLKVTKYK